MNPSSPPASVKRISPMLAVSDIDETLGMKACVMPLILATLSSACAQKGATWPVKVENMAAIHLDPGKSSLEEHIHVLSPLTDARLNSEEYRERLRKGLRHPETLRNPGGDYLFVPPSTGGGDLFGLDDRAGSHVYRLDRSEGRFYASFNDTGLHCEFHHSEEGWWAEHTTVRFTDTRPASK